MPIFDRPKWSSKPWFRVGARVLVTGEGLTLFKIAHIYPEKATVGLNSGWKESIGKLMYVPPEFRTEDGEEVCWDKFSHAVLGHRKEWTIDVTNGLCDECGTHIRNMWHEDEGKCFCSECKPYTPTGKIPEPITAEDLYRLMLTFVKLPYAKVCRHTAAIELFQLLEQKGYNPPDELAKTLVDASAGDERSEEILTELIGQ